MAKEANLSNREWELLRAAPHWVFAAMGAADGRTGLVAKRKEELALTKLLSTYKTNNDLIKVALDAADDDHDIPKDASVTDAEAMMAKINDLLEDKVEREQGEEYRDFLMTVGTGIAKAAKEKMGRNVDEVSDEEKEALNDIMRALRNRPSDKRARATAEAAAEAKERQELKAKAEARRKAVAARASKERDAKNKREELHKQRIAAAKAAKVKREAEEARQAKVKAAEEKAQAEADARTKAEAELRKMKREEMRRKVAEQRAKRREEQKAKAAANKAAAAAAAEAAKPKYVAQHTVGAGDTLSAIALKYYGSAARSKWMAIYEANSDVLSSPNVIVPGQSLKIPVLD